MMVNSSPGNLHSSPGTLYSSPGTLYSSPGTLNSSPETLHSSPINDSLTSPRIADSLAFGSFVYSECLLQEDMKRDKGIVNKSINDTLGKLFSYQLP